MVDSAAPRGVRGGDLLRPLRGTGVSVQWDGSDEAAYEVGAGDCLVHLALEHAHTLRAGADGLEVLAFGERHYAANTLLPRAGVSWLGPTWVLEGAPDDHPWKREAAVGPPEVGELGRATGADRQRRERRAREPGRRRRSTGRCATSAGPRAPSRPGCGSSTSAPGKLVNPPHCHSAEEEIFVVLEGEGTLELWPHLRLRG